MFNICHNALIAVAVIAIAVICCVSIATGHDGIELGISAIIAIAGVGAPIANKLTNNGATKLDPPAAQ